MDRRKFLASSLLAQAGLAASGGATVTPAGSAAQSQEEKPMGVREYYELRVYHLHRGNQPKLVADYWREAAVPALNRAGIRPVGVFNVLIGPESPSVYVLISYPSLDSRAKVGSQLDNDAEYQRTGAAFLNAAASDPAYVRVESSLMVAFEGMPRLVVPAAAAENRPRIFELRTYESHSKKANLKKIEMFNRGELAIFRRTGLRAVFFGETLIGSRLPNLTYMLEFANIEERAMVWARFAADPEWKKLSTTPGYTDVETVSNITNVLLTPAPFSQI